MDTLKLVQLVLVFCLVVLLCIPTCSVVFVKTIPVGDDDEDDDDDLHLKHPFPLPCTSSLNSCFVVFGRED